ncbi:MAG: M1 family peptidase [Lysobacterales bacterium]|nr:MAG: M1 family peptidase [Xanthomonadales bacterium]
MKRLVALALLISTAVAGPATAAPAVQARLDVRLDPTTRELAGQGTWLLPPGRAWQIVLDERHGVQRFTIDGRTAEVPARSGHGLRNWSLDAAPRERRIEVHWRGRLEPIDGRIDHRSVLTSVAPIAGPNGAFLPAASYWHPVVRDAALSYRIAVTAPSPHLGVAPGALLSERAGAGGRTRTYAFEQPDAAIDLMVGPYVVGEREHRSVDGRRIALRTLLHPEIAERSAGDLDAIERYLRLYERWIGPYPFDTFSLVSSPVPTGFGMPTLAYLGVDVLRLPFIRDTSLGHEVLHNWWGHGVRPDYARGNWAEGLTTFMADYTYQERAGPAAARDARTGWLRNFASIGDAADEPLVRFTSRTHGVEQVVGYQKAAMVFAMLRDLVGEAAFDHAIREFWREHRGGVAGWDDLRAAFEAASQRDLRAWLAQWLERPGGPDLRLAAAATEPEGPGWRTRVTITQASPPYRLRVPVALAYAGGERTLHWIDVDGARTEAAFDVPRRPDRVVLDPEARVFRRLAPREAPPILRQAMLDPAAAIVLVTEGPVAEALARALVEGTPSRLEAKSAPPAGTLLVVGMAGDVEAYLERHSLPRRPPEIEARSPAATGWAWTTERTGAGPLAVVEARDDAALAALARPLPHHGRQSWIVFEGARAIARGTWPLRPQEIVLDRD